jgi:hypothetical protein
VIQSSKLNQQKGVDMITWGADGRITEFKVMIRPRKAINIIHEMMDEMLRTIK